MITTGMDMGVQSVKLAIIEDNEVISRSIAPCGFNPRTAAKKAFQEVLKKDNLSLEDIHHVTSTGAGADKAPHSDTDISMMSCIAQAGAYYFPSARTVIDIGAEEARAVSCDENGNLLNFVLNSRCAAGAGTFIESMARALEIKLEELGPLSLKAEESSSINASCVIFAESDVVSLIHRQESKPKIARAIYDSMADRISSMVRRLGVKPQVVLVGGVARDVGFVSSLKRNLGIDLLIPQDPIYAGAVGAALIAAKRVK